MHRYSWYRAESSARRKTGPPPPVRAPAVWNSAPSGSTGPAKGVTHTHQTLGWMFASAAQAYQLSPDDIMMAASSCSHVGGFTSAFCAWAEAALVLAPPVGDPHLLLDMMRRWKPTLVVMLPAALFDLERDAEATAADFASLRLVASGGDKVPDEMPLNATGKVDRVALKRQAAERHDLA